MDTTNISGSTLSLFSASRLRIFSDPLFILLAGSLILLFAINLVYADSRNVLGLVPVNTLISHSYVWNLITSSFFETNFLKLLLDLIGLYLIFIDLEYDSIESFGLYLLLCTLSCSLVTSFYCFVRFFTTANETMLVNPLYGFTGVYFALLSYVRKTRQNSCIHLSFPTLTYQNVTFWIYSIQLISCTLGIKMLSRDIIFSSTSILFSWAYLRFIYKDKNGEIGDQSEGFKFVNIFPTPLHSIAIPLSTAFYNIFALLGLFPPLESERKVSQHHLRQQISKSETSSTQVPVSRTSDIVSERRRAKAQKLLDAKMAQLSKEADDWGEDEVVDV